ncbi:hypothetical protein [uncultured Rothia sp.]|uniref:hypothetical protein n=1 Tax=uncultured Rothia sp. TaxID=316088 RepID=UPI00261A3B34|nr:hypothetical protein [uncultured Rothia sp.]
MRTFLIILWSVDAFGALVRVEYFDSAQPQNAWVKVLVTDEGARVRAVCVYAVQDEAKADSQSAEFVSAVEDAQAWLPQCPDSVEVEGVTLVPVSTSVFSYDGNDSRLLQVSSDGSGSSLNYGAAGFVSSVASWGSADDSAVSFSLLCASTDGRVLAAGGASAGVPEFGVPSTGANAGSVAGFDASVMHPLVWDENSFVPRVLGVGGSSVSSVGSLVPGAGSGAGLLDPYGWASLGVVAPAVPSAQGAPAGGVPVLPDSLVGVSAASGVVLGSSGFEVLGARVVDSRVARFTAPDPLSAPVGAGWGADPFSLVGGNPVSLVDPWGLSPVSVEDFEKYREQKASSGITGWVKRTATDVANGAVTLWDKGKKFYRAATETAKTAWNNRTVLAKNAWEGAKKWWKENKAYVWGGAAVAAGMAISALSVAGGPLTMVVFGALGGAISSAGMSVITQKAQKGSFEWKEVAKDAAIGAVVGGITGGIGGRILAGARQAAGVVTKPNWATGLAAKITDWKWANNLIRKPVDYKPLAGLKGTSGVADDVAMMAPAREAKEFMSKQVARLMAPGEHTMIISRGWWHNQAVSQVTTMQPIKFAVDYAVGGLVAGASSVATSTMHTAEDIWRNIHKK